MFSVQLAQTIIAREINEKKERKILTRGGLNHDGYSRWDGLHRLSQKRKELLLAVANLIRLESACGWLMAVAKF